MMLKDDAINEHLILRYAYTIDFCRTFRWLTYAGIELPFVMLNPFHTYIAPLVDGHLGNSKHIKTLQKKYHLWSIRAINRQLLRLPKPNGKVPWKNQRRLPQPAMMCSIQFAPYLIKKFANQPVIFYLAGENDKAFLRDLRLPKRHRIYAFYQHVQKIKLDPKLGQNLRQKIMTICAAKNGHPLFSTKPFQDWLHKQCLAAMRRIQALRNYLKRNPVTLFFDHNYVSSPGNILTLLGHQYRIPFVHVMHYLLSDISLLPARAHYYCVWGELQKAWYQSRGISKSKIFTLGSVRFEGLLQRQRHNVTTQATLRKQLGIPKEHTIFTFTTQTLNALTNTNLIHWIEYACDKHPATVIIRPHPGDKSDYSVYTNHHRQIIVSPPNIDIYTLLSGSDYVLTISSNTALEALLLGKGIVVLQPHLPYHFQSNYNDFHAHLAKGGAGYIADTKQALRQIMQGLCFDPNQREIIMQLGQDYLSRALYFGGSPTNRLKICLSLLSNRHFKKVRGLFQ